MWSFSLADRLLCVQVMSILFEVESLRVREPRNILQVSLIPTWSLTEMSCWLGNLRQGASRCIYREQNDSPHISACLRRSCRQTPGAQRSSS